MASKASFKAEEWDLVRRAPDWVYTALGAAEGSTAMMARTSEARVYQKALADYKTNNALIKEIIAGSSGQPVEGANLTAAEAALSEIGVILANRLDPQEAGEVRKFLVELGQTVAEAGGGGLFGLGGKVSKKEKTVLDKIGESLDQAPTARKAPAQPATPSGQAGVEAKPAAKRPAEPERRPQTTPRPAQPEAKRPQPAARPPREPERARREEPAPSAKPGVKAKAPETAAVETKAAGQAPARVEKAYITEHTVVAGDSLSGLALKYYGSTAPEKWQPIYEANKAVIGADPNRIAPGQVLKIPKLPETGGAKRAVAPAVESYLAEYTVVPGDTLGGIALKYYGSAAPNKWQAIYEANKAVIGPDPNRISPGQVLKVPKLA